MKVKASSTFVLLLVALGPLASAHRGKNFQPLDASVKSAKATGATLPAKEAVEVLKPVDAVVAEIASADKAAEEVPGAMPTGSRPAEEAAEVPLSADAVVPVPSAVRALRGTALPVATGIAISTVNAVAAKALPPPVGSSLALPGSMLKTIGLISSSILQQGAMAAMATTPQATAAASQLIIAPTPLNALEAFCGRWVEDKKRRRIIGHGLLFDYMVAQEAFEEQVWLDNDGVLCSKEPAGPLMTFPLNRSSSVLAGGRIYTKTDKFEYGHMITTMRDMTEDEPGSVMSLQIHNPWDFDIYQWIDKQQLHHHYHSFSTTFNQHSFSTTFNREGPRTCSRAA